MAALCLPCMAAVASSAASDSRRVNTVYSLTTVYNTVYSIPSTGTYTVPFRFVVSSTRMANSDPHTVPFTVYAYCVYVTVYAKIGHMSEKIFLS